MSLPEISRRCRSCGGAVRAGARFCPQCGKLMDVEPDADAPSVSTDAARAESEAAERIEPEASAPVETPATLEPEARREWTPPTKEFSAFVESLGDGTPRVDSEAHAEAASAPAPEPLSPVSEAPSVAADAVVAADDGAAAAAERARGRVARVREGTRARVGKMKDEALVVLEETPDDSGLRFVVAAAALFLIFLLVLFLSTTVLR
ncbi:MAG: hypothetical protein QOJ70_3280 [Acidobacteriota bacterium]|nr:hypothetical protein [Acidobacteriota bacterium]